MSDAAPLIDETLGFEYVTLQALNNLSSCEVHVQRVLSELSVSTKGFTPLGSYECSSMLVTETSNATNTTYDDMPCSQFVSTDIASWLSNLLGIRRKIWCQIHHIDELMYSTFEGTLDENENMDIYSELYELFPRRMRNRYYENNTEGSYTIS